MPHPAHLIVSNDCQFHLATYLPSGWIVSTVGEYFPSRISREIHAKIFDPKWHRANNHLKGDVYDAAYFRRFGFSEIGAARTYETMVFRAMEMPANGCSACPYAIESGDNRDFEGYNNARDAYRGHERLCKKWAEVTEDRLEEL